MVRGGSKVKEMGSAKGGAAILNNIIRGGSMEKVTLQ